MAVVQKSAKKFSQGHVFSHIVSAETIFFLNFEIQRSQYILPKVTVYKCAETIQGRGLNTVHFYSVLLFFVFVDKLVLATK